MPEAARKVVDDGKYVMSVVVAMTGIDAHRIRRYEEAGLLKPCRTAGRQRRFSDADVVVLREVVRLGQEGINMKGIRRILEMRQRNGSA
jgi:DNA-binding transcriptional MerR regulator